MVHLHNGALLSHKKRHLEMCMEMDDLEKKILSEVTKTQKEEHGLYSLISGLSRTKTKDNEPIVHYHREASNKEIPKRNIHGSSGKGK